MSRKKSVQEHVRDGTYRRDRHGPLPSGVVEALGGESVALPVRPADLPPDAVAVWDVLIRLLAGVVRDRDGPMLAEACRWWAELKRVQAALAETAPGERGYNSLLTGAGTCSDRLDKILSRFGLTPADRAKLKVEASGPPVAKVPTRPKTKLDQQGPPKK